MKKVFYVLGIGLVVGIQGIGCEQERTSPAGNVTDTDSTGDTNSESGTDTEKDTNTIDTENMPPGCGDGILTSDEACDDGNHENGDGCTGDCLAVEEGWSCNPPGQPCHQMAVCGDGAVLRPELCDDGNLLDGDGCSDSCKVEIGWACEGSPSVCYATTCGDGIQEGAESCDDGNAVPFDGCSAECQQEPDCSAGACASECGDGLVLGEECDDGNRLDGDGCSSDCKVEEGYTCVQEGCEDEATCTLKVAAVYRDFDSTHSDFAVGCDGLVTGAVESSVGTNWKPVATGIAGTNCTTAFGDWYTAAVSKVGEIVLYPDGNGGFVNRYGDNGEPWMAEPVKSKCADGPTLVECSRNADDCAACPTGDEYEGWTCEYPCPSYDDQRTCLVGPRPACDQCPGYGQPGFTCVDPCGDSQGWEPWDLCQSVGAAYDGNPLFFPLDDMPGAKSPAKVPEQYGYDGWPWEEDVTGVAVQHNFYFTTEVTYWFQYDETNPATLNFTGDDDVWVFVNGQLAVDLGGVHVPLDGSVVIGGPTGESYGMEHDKVYRINIFHAERKMEGSSFKLTLGGFNTARSDCSPVCGDGVIGLGEQCDDGVNDGGYGECAPGCVLGEYCGDGIIQDEYEDCDDGNFLDGDDCPSSCRVLIIE